MIISSEEKLSRRTVAIVVARGGSKRLPGKNIKDFAGKPLLAHSIDYAKSISKIDQIYLSTDNEEIAQVGRRYGATIINRPQHLALDTTLTAEVLQHFAQEINEKVNIVLLQPTNPIRFEDLFDGCFNRYVDPDIPSSSVISVSRSYTKLGKVKNNRYIPYNYFFGQRSQDLEPLYYENGNMIIIPSEMALESKVFDEDSTVYIEQKDSTDIDTLEDFHAAEDYWLRIHGTNNNKHVFIVHSAITLLVAENVIKYHNINHNDVIMIPFRNTKVSDKYKKIIIPDEGFILNDNIYRNISSHFPYRFYYNHQKLINEHIGCNFILYTPQLAASHYRIYGFMNQCIGINFIEEGSASYSIKECDPNDIFFFKEKSEIDKHNYFNLSPFSKKIKDNVKFYALSNLSFPFLDHGFLNNKIVLINPETVDFTEQYFINEDKVTILALTSIYHYLPSKPNSKRTFTSIDYLESLDKIIDEIKEETIYLKLHPLSFNSNLEKIVIDKIKNKGKQVSLIDKDCVLEYYFISAMNKKQQKYKLYVDSSSLHLYALIYGQQSTCFEHLIEKALIEGYTLFRYKDFTLDVIPTPPPLEQKSIN